MADLAKALTNRPIPGQSLTKPPEARAPYETPPSDTELSVITNKVFRIVMSDEVMEPLGRMKGKVKLDKLAGVILHEAFANGKISPDSAMLAVEPTINALLMASAMLGVRPRFSDDKEDEDWTGILKVSKKQARKFGVAAPASMEEWLAQNDKVQEEEQPAPIEKSKRLKSLLDSADTGEE